MYIPNHFQFESDVEKIAFMKQYSFGTIITVVNGIPIATHLPFFIDDSSGKLLLSSHFAKANEQAKYIETNISLVVFTGPNGYISPEHYDKYENVPTWDYISVHAYGKAIIINEDNTKEKVLKQMIHVYEPTYAKQWNDLPEKYKKGMMQGIVIFELEVTELQGKKKLSQNRTENERQQIIEHLEKSENTIEKDMANYIRNI